MYGHFFQAFCIPLLMDQEVLVVQLDLQNPDENIKHTVLKINKITYHNINQTCIHSLKCNELTTWPDGPGRPGAPGVPGSP